MALKVGFTIKARIPKPLPEVFQAIYDQSQLCSFFTKTANGPLVAGRSVEWGWHNEVSETIQVQEVQPNSKIVFTWNAYQVDYQTRVEFTFESLEESLTLVSIGEWGWQENQPGLDSSYEHCSGWQHMLICLKARLLHDIDLR